MSVVDPGPLIEPPDGSDAEAITAACAAVRTYCGWHIAPSLTHDMVIDGQGSTTLLLPTMQVTAINSVSVYPGTMIDGADTVGDVDLARVEWSTAGVLRGPFRTRRFRAITINVTHGFVECPADIRAVVLGLARAGIAPSRATTQLAGSFMQVFPKEATGGAVAMSAYDTAILDRYRLPDRS